MLDLWRRHRVERRARFVLQQQFGLCFYGPGDAEPLLLAAGKGQRPALQLVLNIVPQRRRLESLLHSRVSVTLKAFDRSTNATLLYTLVVKGFGCWNTIPMRVNRMNGLIRGFRFDDYGSARARLCLVKY
jgi:hypothetical protein